MSIGNRIWLNIFGAIVLAISAIANMAVGCFIVGHMFNFWVGVSNMFVMGLLMYEARRLMYSEALQKAKLAMEEALKALEENEAGGMYNVNDNYPYGWVGMV